MGFIDNINALIANIPIRYSNKTAALSITKYDHANTFNDVVALLMELYVPDDVRTIPFTGTVKTIDWQNDYPPNTNMTFAEIFGDSPEFTLLQNNGDHTYTDIKDFGVNRVKDVDDITLLMVTIIPSAFAGVWELIVNYGTGAGQSESGGGSLPFTFNQGNLDADTDGNWYLPFAPPSGKVPVFVSSNRKQISSAEFDDDTNRIYGFLNNNTQTIKVYTN